MTGGGKAAETLLHQRQEGRRTVKNNKIVVARLKMKRRVFIEQPGGSQWVEEPEMTDVKRLIDTGELLKFIVDGCSVGYANQESEWPAQLQALQ